ncbi:hypothetical protein WJX84_002696, partial [Apatococcus fuscideae]
TPDSFDAIYITEQTPLNKDKALLSPVGGFGISQQQLLQINENKDKAEVANRGGLPGLAAQLGSDVKSGVSTQGEGILAIEQRQSVFGQNRFKEMPQKSFFFLLWENLQDPTLILLMIAAAVSTVLGVVIPSEREQKSWTEGVAIWVAVAVVSGVASGNDYSKDKQFRKLNAAKDNIKVKVVRDGQQTLVDNGDVVVGDLLQLDTGDKIVADGITTEFHGMVVDEASLTGESEPVKKGEDDVFCRSGTQVTEGSGTILVLAVGPNSEWGKTMALVQTEAVDTPLQGNLTQLAAAIGKIGLFAGILCFVALMIRWMIENHGFPADKIASGPLSFFIFGITIVVVAVPEGLPLAVTISLAYSMRKMMKDNNFVRVLAACETMGGATAICSDKTGTLTENRMTVVEGWFAGKQWPRPPTLEELPEAARHPIAANIAINSKAFLLASPKGTELVGNRTECALANTVERLGQGLCADAGGVPEPDTQAVGFLLGQKDGQRPHRGPPLASRGLYNKGVITAMAERGLRTLCLAYRDMPDAPAASELQEQPAEDLTACCIVGIKDPVRKEVPDAVAVCKRAGITVRMVTGDNLHTAQHIARECGIMFGDGTAMEGPTFRSMPDEDAKAILPKLQVLARSSPTDKYRLVSLLQSLQEIVAVTGDGTNDAPALKKSDVGLAMGIAGTEVAKEAADIVIMDDNFKSIVKSVLWGRSVFENIRKFLQFQMTVNFVALVLAFVAAVTNGEQPLNVLQLLWVNLIMDALAALALATEDPAPELLLNKPHGRNEPLINGLMWKHIACQAVYQLFWLFLIFYGASSVINGFVLPSSCASFEVIDSHYIKNVSLLNPSASVLEFNPAAYHNQDDWKCRYGPCLNMCCLLLEDGSCADNLVANGGHYLSGEKPMCWYTGQLDRLHTLQCNLQDPSKQPQVYCQDGTQHCDRYTQMQNVFNRGTEQQGWYTNFVQEKPNSLVFNVFIFLQLFNELNSRKIQDELNVFSGLLKSHVFLYVFIIVVGFQILIVETPINNFFKTTQQSWKEWLFAIAVGAGGLLVSFLVRLISRRPRHF